MVVKICVLYFIIIINWEVWTIIHCLEWYLETIVCAVCLAMFLAVTHHLLCSSLLYDLLYDLLFKICWDIKLVCSKLHRNKAKFIQVDFIITLSSITWYDKNIYKAADMKILWISTNLGLGMIISPTISSITFVPPKITLISLYLI